MLNKDQQVIKQQGKKDPKREGWEGGGEEGQVSVTVS